VKEFIPKKHGAVNKLLQGCHVWMGPSWVSFTGEFSRLGKNDFNLLKGFFMKKKTQNCQILKGKKFQIA
jgi:hypothetical protein